MKDAFDVILDVRTLLDKQVIAKAYGKPVDVWNNERPSGRAELSDIVINCLGISNSAIQKGSGNINCYVPSIQSGGQKMADQLGLMALSRVIIPLVDVQYRASFITWLEDAPNILQDTDGSYFVNIPFEYQSIQDNYKNI